MKISYLNKEDQIIIDWLCALEDTINKNPNTTFSLFTAFSLGDYLYAYKELPIEVRNQYEKFQSLDHISDEGEILGE
eukprot:CAMPEP_0114577472 /NCGR_PEP_ID=MMETSP0125-20121206/2123_1 /TAXON_ID=485358 ORGANISM="Aristerostoma sp., Strain ATCC 50986" /NCGR_SAMPLE_ID=MMETSP0125 /ASSEMBLY_ACC=CAM_ASM_000245 /LENGTH=76 /DNA_ID=CAMNT_0001766799 /DNA_START=40 /DNA_END=270 /DNA_ORIENTATION=-